MILAPIDGLVRPPFFQPIIFLLAEVGWKDSKNPWSLFFLCGTWKAAQAPYNQWIYISSLAAPYQPVFIIHNSHLCFLAYNTHNYPPYFHISSSQLSFSWIEPYFKVYVYIFWCPWSLDQYPTNLNRKLYVLVISPRLFLEFCSF